SVREETVRLETGLPRRANHDRPAPRAPDDRFHPAPGLQQRPLRRQGRRQCADRQTSALPRKERPVLARSELTPTAPSDKKRGLRHLCCFHAAAGTWGVAARAAFTSASGFRKAKAAASELRWPLLEAGQQPCHAGVLSGSGWIQRPWPSARARS